MIVNICGIPHKVIEYEDNFNVDLHFGQIDYKACEIRINKDMNEEAKKEAICHEMVHGILVHLGYNEHSQNEQFVQALANAICQGFDIKFLEEMMGPNLDSLQAVRDYVKQRESEESNGKDS